MSSSTQNRPVSFELHIQILFTADQRSCMQGYLDLWDYNDVRANASTILARLSDHSMPADNSNPWPNEWITLFERWITEGCSP